MQSVETVLRLAFICTKEKLLQRAVKKTRKRETDVVSNAYDKPVINKRIHSEKSDPSESKYKRNE